MRAGWKPRASSTAPTTVAGRRSAAYGTPSISRGAGAGPDQPEQHPQGGGLARSVRPEEPGDLPRLDVEAEPVDGGDRTEPLAQLVRREPAGGFGHGPIFPAAPANGTPWCPITGARLTGRIVVAGPGPAGHLAQRVQLAVVGRVRVLHGDAGAELDVLQHRGPEVRVGGQAGLVEGLGVELDEPPPLRLGDVQVAVHVDEVRGSRARG